MSPTGTNDSHDDDPPGATEAPHGDSSYQDAVTPMARPMPPYPVDLLADLHADVLPERVAAHIRAHLDADARRTLAALDATVADLRSAPVVEVPVPDHVLARTDATLAAIRDEVSASSPSTVIPLPRRRRSVWPALLTAAAAIIAVVAVGVGITSFGDNSPDHLDAADTTTTPTVETITDADQAQLLSALGNRSPAFATEAALRGCTQANAIPDSTEVLGSQRITVQGRNAIVVLLSTGVAGRFDALVVGLDCGPGQPSTITRTTIGG